MYVYDPELNVGVNLRSMTNYANLFLPKGKVLAAFAGAALGGGARVVAVLAALRDVAHDAQQGAEEDGREDKMNVTTKRCCTAAAETAREVASSACCSWRGKAAAPLRDCSRQRHRT